MKKLLNVLSCFVFLGALTMSFNLVDENKPVLTTVYYWDNPGTQNFCRDAEVDLQGCQRVTENPICERNLPTTSGSANRQIHELSNCNSAYYEPNTR